MLWELDDGLLVRWGKEEKEPGSFLTKKLIQSQSYPTCKYEQPSMQVSLHLCWRRLKKQAKNELAIVQMVIDYYYNSASRLRTLTLSISSWSFCSSSILWNPLAVTMCCCSCCCSCCCCCCCCCCCDDTWLSLFDSLPFGSFPWVLRRNNLNQVPISDSHEVI